MLLFWLVINGLFDVGECGTEEPTKWYSDC